ncbi:hypothetical protein [Pedobacter alluvionis]|uniref:Uncharacterized protein n=1 Tax=Pedobacter alluvionis TaxID=475253 RepID=A0A497Y493_9SPHI|nr:hypothetical protein [Pedobacter alluvionis]RLJ77334.1 hypothetical protein BCL90_2419 [Pedobacter alluvionis]TFB33444.1 hypothetical protein E3V97_05195 [Pedobacter alluvionis]
MEKKLPLALLDLDNLKSLKIELKGTDALAIQQTVKMVITELKKYTGGGSDRLLAASLEAILKKNESQTDLLELDGKEIIDMRHGLYHAMRMLDDKETDDDTKLADQIEIIFDKVEMISA